MVWTCAVWQWWMSLTKVVEYEEKEKELVEDELVQGW